MHERNARSLGAGLSGRAAQGLRPRGGGAPPDHRVRLDRAGGESRKHRHRGGVPGCAQPEGGGSGGGASRRGRPVSAHGERLLRPEIGLLLSGERRFRPAPAERGRRGCPCCRKREPGGGVLHQGAGTSCGGTETLGSGRPPPRKYSFPIPGHCVGREDAAAAAFRGRASADTGTSRSALAPFRQSRRTSLFASVFDWGRDKRVSFRNGGAASWKRGGAAPERRRAFRIGGTGCPRSFRAVPCRRSACSGGQDR